MAQNFELQNLTPSNSEEVIFEQTEETEHEHLEYGYMKRRYYLVLTYIRQHYLSVIKVLLGIILMLLVLITILAVLWFSTTEVTTTTPAHSVDAFRRIYSIETEEATQSPYPVFPRLIGDYTDEEKMRYLEKKIEEWKLRKSTPRAVDKVNNKDPGVTALPSKLKMCSKIRCAANTGFVISKVNIEQLKIYGCCKSPSQVEFEAVTKVKERFDMYYSSKIKYIEYLPKLINLTGSWATGSFNDQEVFVFRGVGLVPPDPDEID